MDVTFQGNASTHIGKKIFRVEQLPCQGEIMSIFELMVLQFAEKWFSQKKLLFEILMLHGVNVNLVKLAAKMFKTNYD